MIKTWNKTETKNVTLNFDVEFASMDNDFQSIPYGYIDKTVCGCGLTTVALESRENVILTVPNVELVDNKVAQYPNERVDYEILAVKGGVTREDVDDYIRTHDVLKIMVVYDSLHKVEHLLYKCRLIIDESNELLSAMKLKVKSKKVSTSKDVINHLLDVAEAYKDSVSFISATPIPLEYLPEWISEIPQIKMKWSNTIKAKPILMQRTYPYKALRQEIITPIEQNGEVELGGAKFKKAIIFVNSINVIPKIAKACNIKGSDIGYIASNNVSTDIKLKGSKRVTNPTNLPKYTFITSSGFKGIDLVDKEAISIVISNTDKNYHMLDMNTDLKQAISRQRDKSNPNYDKFVYIFNQSAFDKTREELESRIEQVRDNINSAIRLWEYAKNNNEERGFKYTESAEEFKVYTVYDHRTKEYKLNEMLFNADKYFILNTREQYKKGFDIKAQYGESESIAAPEQVKEITYLDMVNHFNKYGDIEKFKHKVDYYNLIMDCVKYYGKVWTDYTYAVKMVKYKDDDFGKVATSVYKFFQTGKSYTVAAVKTRLNTVYAQNGLDRKAKSTDLYEFFDIENSSARIDGKNTRVVYIKRSLRI